jgi:hypothetical protein
MANTTLTRKSKFEKKTQTMRANEHWQGRSSAGKRGGELWVDRTRFRMYAVNRRFEIPDSIVGPDMSDRTFRARFENLRKG